MKFLLKRKLYITEDEEIGSAWCDDGFGINVRKEYKHVIENLYDAFQNKKGIIKKYGGLILLDYRKIPEEAKKDFEGYMSNITFN